MASSSAEHPEGLFPNHSEFCGPEEDCAYCLKFMLRQNKGYNPDNFKFNEGTRIYTLALELSTCKLMKKTAADLFQEITEYDLKRWNAGHSVFCFECWQDEFIEEDGKITVIARSAMPFGFHGTKPNWCFAMSTKCPGQLGPYGFVRSIPLPTCNHNFWPGPYPPIPPLFSPGLLANRANAQLPTVHSEVMTRPGSILPKARNNGSESMDTRPTSTSSVTVPEDQEQPCKNGETLDIIEKLLRRTEQRPDVIEATPDLTPDVTRQKAVATAQRTDSTQEPLDLDPGCGPCMFPSFCCCPKCVDDTLDGSPEEVGTLFLEPCRLPQPCMCPKCEGLSQIDKIEKRPEETEKELNNGFISGPPLSTALAQDASTEGSPAVTKSLPVATEEASDETLIARCIPSIARAEFTARARGAAIDLIQAVKEYDSELAASKIKPAWASVFGPSSSLALPGDATVEKRRAVTEDGLAATEEAPGEPRSTDSCLDPEPCNCRRCRVMAFFSGCIRETSKEVDEDLPPEACRRPGPCSCLGCRVSARLMVFAVRQIEEEKAKRRQAQLTPRDGKGLPEPGPLGLLNSNGNYKGSQGVSDDAPTISKTENHNVSRGKQPKDSEQITEESLPAQLRPQSDEEIPEPSNLSLAESDEKSEATESESADESIDPETGRRRVESLAESIHAALASGNPWKGLTADSPWEGLATGSPWKEIAMTAPWPGARVFSLDPSGDLVEQDLEAAGLLGESSQSASRKRPKKKPKPKTKAQKKRAKDRSKAQKKRALAAKNRLAAGPSAAS